MQNFLPQLATTSPSKQHSISLPTRVIECCSPVTFAAVGYPMRIGTIRSAGRYIDAVQEARTELTFQVLIGALTEDELSNLRSIASAIANMSEQHYGRRLVPRSALLRAAAVVRQIRNLVPRRQQTILEIGGGSGYIGALLVQMGYGYISTDITQAFYIVQNHVLNAVAGDRFIELATDPRSFFDFPLPPRGSCLHVPWWKFVVADVATEIFRRSDHVQSRVARDGRGCVEIQLSYRACLADGRRIALFPLRRMGKSDTDADMASKNANDHQCRSLLRL